MRKHLLSVGLIFILVGCGGVSTAPVSGKVILDGKPLAGATVTFMPAETKGAPGPPSSGITDENGQYSLTLTTDHSIKGAVVGKHKVSISAIEGGSDGAAGANPKPRVEKVSAEYNANTTLTFDVPAGGTTSADFKIDNPPSMPK
jgi:hypothetical protein